MLHPRTITHWITLGVLTSCSAVANSARGQCEQAKLIGGAGSSGDRFGIAVAIDREDAIVGAYLDDTGGVDAGAAYVLLQTADGWFHRAKLVAADADAEDWFGFSVAIDGDYAVVGAFGDDDFGHEAGSAYVFWRQSAHWVEQAKLRSNDIDMGDRFGCAVAIRDPYILVGAYLDDDQGPASGSVYVFKREGTFWTEQEKLTAGDGQSFAFFGRAVAITENAAVVGAFGNDDFGGDPFVERGAAYIFTRAGGAWIEQDKVTPGSGGLNDRFGFSVAIDEDDLLVGAYLDSQVATYAGAAYLFRRSGPAWTQRAKLMASDEAEGDEFGISVSLLDRRVAVGAWLDDDGGDGSGSVYLFNQENGFWVEQAKVTASDAAPDDLFGVSVALGKGTALVGAYLDDDGGEDSGSVYGYRFGAGSGDADGDGDVDLLDFRHLQVCFTAEARIAANTGCCAFDFEPDGDLDLDDFSAFQDAARGGSRSP